MAIVEAGKETLKVAQFLTCLRFRLPNQPVNLYTDNKEAISIIENPKFHQKTKHIEVY